MIENVIPEILDGERKKTALDFVAYMRGNKLKPVWTLTNTWKAMYKGKNLYHILLRNDEWKETEQRWGKNAWLVKLYIFHTDKYYDQIMSEELQNFIWDNIKYCTNCGGKCTPGHDAVILGKQIKGQCNVYPLVWAFDPNEAAIESIKRLLELEMQARNEQAKQSKESKK